MSMNVEKTMKSFREQKDLMEDRIKNGIEANRKGWFRISLKDKNGKPLTGAKISVKQKTSEFKFGCNIFKLGCFEKDEENAAYEEKFAKLFNMATLPFYWESFEPQKGNMRFEKNSEFIDRRIPPELAIEFCKKHNIEMKGHPIFWNVMLPEWLPNDYEQMKYDIVDRIKAIAERYDGVMRTFDCVNECTSVPNRPWEKFSGEQSTYRNFKPSDGNYADYMFKMVDKYFSKTKFVLNETTDPWMANNFKAELSSFYLLAQNLIRAGKQVDILGFQFHCFNTPETMETLAADLFNPANLYRVMDCYNQFNKPMSVTEITIPGYDEDAQAEAIKNLYSMWFSDKNMESIIYWNLGDNCAISGRTGWAEDAFKSGWYRNDFSNKPVFDVMDNLINKEWRTNLSLETKDDNAYFKAFYGDYEVSVVHNGKEIKRDLHLSKRGWQEFVFEF